jgi:hypothetical protein
MPVNARTESRLDADPVGSQLTDSTCLPRLAGGLQKKSVIHLFGVN